MAKENLKQKLNITHAMVAFAFSGIFYILLLKVNGIVPFGDNTWISFDMKRQYLDYYAFYKTIFSGGNSPFYSFDTALGSGTIGLFAYYLTSPFLLILALFPVDMFPLGITIVIGLKLALASLTFDVLLQKLCGKGAYICSVSYAFCAYMMSNALNLMWLDVFILLPILIITAELLLHEGKLMGYTILTALIIYLNYYISYIVLIFVVLWSVVRLIEIRDKNPQEAVMRLILGTGAGIGIDAFILLPTFVELFKSPGEALAGDVGEAMGNLMPSQIITKMFSLSYDQADLYWGKPLIFCGVLMLILALLYFLNKNISLREKISMGALLLIMAVSFAYEELNVLWHIGMKTSEYSYREAIFFVFVILICACRSLQEIKDGVSVKSFIAVAVIVTLLLVAIFKNPEAFLNGWKMEVNIALAAVSLIIIFALRSAKSKKISLLTVVILSLIQFSDIGINASYIYRMESMMEEKAAEYSSTVDRIASTVSAVKKQDSTFYRMESWTPRQQNDSMMHDYKGITHYSSAGLTYVRYFLQKMGYNDDGLYTDYGHDNTQTADSILGIKYLMTDRAHGYRMHKDYDLRIDGDIQVYENPYALPAGIGVYREMSGESSNPFFLQEDIYSRLSGEPTEIFVSANVQSSGDENGEPVREYRVIADADGEMYFYMSDLIGAHRNLEIYYNNEFLTYYGNDACLKVLNLGYFKRGDYFIVHVKAEDADDFGEAFFVTEDTQALKEAYDKTISRHATVTSIGASKLAMTLDSAYTVGDDISGEVGVFTTIPFQKGWKVKVSGVRVEPIEIYDALIYIPITEALQQAELGPDENIRIELSFIPEGFYLGAGISVLAIIVIVLMASIRKGEASFFGDDEDEDMEEE